MLIATFYVTQRTEVPEDLLAKLAPEITQELLRAKSQGGGIAIDEAHDRIRSALRVNAYLSRNGTSLGTRPMPAPARARLAELLIGQEARFKFDGGGRLLALPMRLSPTDDGHILLFTQVEIDAIASRQSLLYLQLAALLCAAAIVGWLLARGLAGPIRRIQIAVNRVASGDLSSRVQGTLSNDVNELATLARDIDHMAAQMQTMIASRDRLLHHLSHEMRSPLARLRILLEMLRDDGANTARLYERLGKADGEIDRLDSMIDEILGLARFDGNKSPPMTPLSMREIIDECVDFTAVEAEAKSVRLSANIERAGASVLVLGNRELVIRAVDNLLRNAIRHTPANRVVDIALQCQGDDVLLAIGDQGPGVPEPYLHAIFEPFFRLPAAKNPTQPAQAKGYGLGLTLVQLMAKLHGATIVVSNKAAGGLLISIRFRRFA
jgi:signal transduction histidine kinase